MRFQDRRWEVRVQGLGRRVECVVFGDGGVLRLVVLWFRVQGCFGGKVLEVEGSGFGV